MAIRIRDNGDGFSDDSLEHMFRIGFSDWKQEGHEGLGLYIAKRMMHAIGGEIRARNRPEGGAEVELIVRNLE